jgi:aryl-alcohol dehydrogenase-like predicted oxidoreductase
MKYRTLGKTGLQVSVIGLGTMVHAGHFGPMKDSESRAPSRPPTGVNSSTPDAYGAGYPKPCSATLKGKRDKVIPATKGGNVMTGPNRGNASLSPIASAG